MRALAHKIAALIADRRAATAVEYGLILALVVLALLGGLQALGGSTATLWGNINAKVQNAR
ncbi:MAG: Flp family type IVb pilin [Sphingomonadales bacterium]|nr:MAG: Flp family type IVb pilin [Sphingomonadales bacterium]